MTMDAVASPRPVLPLPDKLTAFFWEGAHRGQLMILRCEACGFYVHWPRPICKRCQSFDLKPAEVSGRGALQLHRRCPSLPSVVRRRVPYILAVVELEEQPTSAGDQHRRSARRRRSASACRCKCQFEQLAAETLAPRVRSGRQEGK